MLRFKGIVLTTVLLNVARLHSEHVTYNFIVSYIRQAPDGVPVDILAVNGQFPGPTIRCTLGDTLHVHVKNEIRDRTGKTYPVSVHWHGLLMYGTVFADGPDHITQCPIQYGKTYEYVFTPNQTGTYWWHSHLTWQYSEGMWGTLIVDNPNEPYKNFYEKELVLTLNDWYHTSGKDNTNWYMSPLSGARSPIPDSAMINGRGIYPCRFARAKGLPCTPQRPLVFEVRRYDRYRIRIINTSALLTFQLFIEDHLRLMVIEVDGVDTVPTPVDTFLIAPAQRYSIVVAMNARPGSYEEENFLIRASMANVFPPTGGPNINLFPAALNEYSGFPVAILRYRSMWYMGGKGEDQPVAINAANGNQALAEGAAVKPGPNKTVKWPVGATPQEQFEFLLNNPDALRPSQLEPKKPGGPGTDFVFRPTTVVQTEFPNANLTDFTVQVVTSGYERRAQQQPNLRGFTLGNGITYANFGPSFQPWVVLDEKDLQPYDLKPAPIHDVQVNMTIEFVTDAQTGITFATFDGVRFKVTGKPIIFRMLEKKGIPKSAHPITIKHGKVIQVALTNPYSLPHPFHLHGHTFWVVGSAVIGGPIKWTLDGARRDTVVVNPRTTVYFRFLADNPGAWLFHCHINWHHQAGLAAVFIEGKEEAIKMYAASSVPQSAIDLCKESGVKIVLK